MGWEVEPHLLSMVEYLFGMLTNEQPFLRSISCWTLSKYSNSLFKLDPTGEMKLLQRYLQQLILRLGDLDTLVQEAACTSAISLMDSIPDRILPYAYDILRIFMELLEKYKGPALTGLYDAIGRLVEDVYQDKIRHDEKSLNLLLPPMFNQWNIIKDTDRLLCPLFEWVKMQTSGLREGGLGGGQTALGRVGKKSHKQRMGILGV